MCPSTPEDEKGRIKTIVVTITANGLEFDRGKYCPIINSDFLESIREQIPQDGQNVHSIFCHFFNEEGEVVDTFENVTKLLDDKLPQEYGKDYALEGQWNFPQPVFMDMPPLGKVLIDGFKYRIPAYIDECTFAKDAKGSPVLLIKPENGKVNKLFTDQDLKQYQFKDGEITKVLRR